jgi:hypothetical protein
MPGRVKENNKIYRSIMEFEKEFFPNSFQSKRKNEQEEKPGSFGIELAMEFLRSVKRRLSK